MIVLAQRKRKKEKGEREKVERDHKAASDFSPGIDDRFGTAEELKGKMERLKGIISQPQTLVRGIMIDLAPQKSYKGRFEQHVYSAADFLHNKFRVLIK